MHQHNCSDIFLNIKDYYDILGIDKDARADEIKAAYRAIVRETHPDGIPSGQGLRPPAEARLKKANEAYEILGDAEKKVEYDGTIGNGTSFGYESPFSQGYSTDITGHLCEAHGDCIWFITR